MLSMPVSSGCIERRVEQDAIDDEPDEERLDHLQAGAGKAESEHEDDREAVWPQPPAVGAEKLTAAAGQKAFRFRRRVGAAGVAAGGSIDRALFRRRSFRGGVEAMLLVIPDEAAVALARRP